MGFSIIVKNMDEIKRTFQRYDSDQNGYISYEEGYQVSTFFFTLDISDVSLHIARL